MPTSEARCSLKSAVWRRIEWVHQSANDKTTTWPPAAGSAWKSCFDQLGHERSAVIIQRCEACPWISAIFPGGRQYISPHKMAKKNHWLSWHSRFKREVSAICRFWVFDGNRLLGHWLVYSRWFEKILQWKVVENGVRKKRPLTGISRGNPGDTILCASRFAPLVTHLI